MVKHEPELHKQGLPMSSSTTRLTDQFRYLLDMINIVRRGRVVPRRCLQRRIEGSGSRLGR